MPGTTSRGRGGRPPVALVPVRGVHAVHHVETVLVWAVIAMAVSRSVLGTWVDTWPRVDDPGPGQLLAGALFMLVALLLTLSFVGSTSKTTAAVIGGLGCGLLIGTAEDFFAASHDAYWRSAVTLMYAVFAVTAIGMRYLHDRHSPTSREDLAGAAAIAALGVANGLDPARRVRALRLLERAADRGCDHAAVVDLSRLISRCPQAAPATGPGAWLGGLVASRPARRVVRARWAVGAMCLVLLAQAVVATVDAVVVPGRLAVIGPVTAVCQVLGATAVAALVVAALARLRRDRLAALRLGRYAALITVLTTDSFDFSARDPAGFGDIAVGLLVLAVLIQQIRVLAPDPLA